MMTLIYKKKMEYFKSGGEDWKEVSLGVFLENQASIQIRMLKL